LLDLSLLQIDKYEEVLRQAMSRLWAGEPSQEILNDVAAQWDALTEKIGVDKQRAAYEGWASKPNAYPN
jgi:multiple sugar transport system substrate-binding protein